MEGGKGIGTGGNARRSGAIRIMRKAWTIIASGGGKKVRPAYQRGKKKSLNTGQKFGATKTGGGKEALNGGPARGKDHLCCGTWQGVGKELETEVTGLNRCQKNNKKNRKEKGLDWQQA